MRKTLLFAAFALYFGFFQTQPAKAENLFFDDMEGGINGWTADGFWHQITNPENISVSSDLNPELISLPDDGSLPQAYSGDVSWWYGEDATGTYIGAYTEASQTEKNGGTSNAANSGYLTSSAIDISSAPNATLEFWTWWEIEGVDVNKYDMMYLQASSDGVNYTELGNINPINDVNGEAFKAYSSGGLGKIGQWVKHSFSIDSYVGGTIYLRFYFNTVDQRYNAFRGWFIDDVVITDEATEDEAPTFITSSTGEQLCGDWGAQMTGGTFQLLKSQNVTISLTNASGYWINSYGTNKVVASGTTADAVLLPKGKYTVFPVMLATCPVVGHAYASVSYSSAAPIPNVAQSGGSIAIYGSGFNSNSQVYLVGPLASTSALAATETQASETAVVSETQIEVTLPALSSGLYSIKIVNGSGSKVLKKSLTISNDSAPLISAVSPETISNDVENILSVSGFYFTDGAKVMVGDFPCLNVAVASDGYSLTCAAVKGISPGYQNITVQNKDGQLDTLVGDLNVQDNTEEMFSADDGQIVYLNKFVKNLRIVSRTAISAKVGWKKLKKAKKGYQVEVRKDDGTLVKRVRTKKSPLSTTKVVKGLQTKTQYKVRVQAVNKKGYGVVWSDYLNFKTK